MTDSYLYSARSHFSIGESLLTPKEIVAIAKENNIKTVALVDVMSISGMTDFISECKKQEIKPIIGCTLRVVMDLNYRKPSRTALELPKKNPEFRPKVYVKNDQGMIELMKLLSLANSPERFYEKSRIDFDDLIDALKNGNLLVSTGDLQSIFTVNETDYNYQSLLNRLNSEISSENVFLELFNADSILIDTLNKKASQIASDSAVQTIMTNLLLYRNKEDADTLDVLSTITSNSKMDSPWRNQQWLKSFHSKINNEIKEEVRQGLRRLAHRDGEILFEHTLIGDVTSLIAACEYEWRPLPVSLPKMADDEIGAVMMQVALGWKKRILKPVMGYKPPEELIPDYKKRLAYELSILKRMKFERYFLVVQDVVNWSKRNDIMVGPGRGSVGGSLVAYLMGITDVDPIRFNLLFERFINPDRIDLPDADLDFMSTRRGEVIDYLVGKYGKDRVAGISNYSMLASSSALRDCGRVFGLGNEELSPTRYVPKENGTPFTLEQAAAAVPEIEAFKGKYSTIWHHATKLEGRMRTLGKHAGGVIVADEPIINRAVVETRSETAVVNWDRNSVENQGLVKMDILGLSTLDTLQIALNYIKESRGFLLNLLDLPIDDYETMQGLSRGQTVGIFQLESGGMRHLLKDLAKGGLLTFADICATTALYRPGPMDSGMLDAYVRFRQGLEAPVYDHPKMKSALEATGGVFIYQESVMQVARDLAGYTMADADKLRKIMGKKNKEEMEKQREKFVSGCMTYSEMEEIKASELFDKIAAFAGYGFNLAHSVEYSIISYWAMYLKIHYPAEFFASLLTTADDEDKLQSALLDARKHNIVVLPPDINVSTGKFEIRTDEEAMYLITPLNKLKGLSDKTVDAILEAREKAGGRFKNKDDLLSNVRRRNCTVRHIDVLDRVGAFAEIEPGQLSARHPDRVKDQIELMPGLVMEYVKADRYTKLNDISMAASDVVRGIRGCNDCSLREGKHCIPTAGNKIKFMVITDGPNSGEATEGKMLQGDGCNAMLSAIKEAGLKKNTGYYTSLVKAQKPKEEKTFTNEQLLSCRKFIDAEVKMINPPVIVCLGGATIRHFFPDIKGGWAELAGRVVYSKELDANIVLGINPAMTFFREEAQEMLDDVFRKVAQIIE